MIVMLIELVVVIAGAACIAMAIRLKRPHWRTIRIAAIAAAPLPLLLTAFCLWLIVDALTVDPRQCGVDACAMAIAAGLFGLLLAIGSFLVGLVSTWLLLRYLRSR